MQKKPTRKSIYEPFRNACKEKNTTLTNVLNEVGRSDGNTGSWKNGTYPKLDIVMDIAEYLNISLDELVYGIEECKAVLLDDNQREWLSIIKRIPDNKQALCKDFIKTHALPDKYEDKEKVS